MYDRFLQTVRNDQEITYELQQARTPAAWWEKSFYKLHCVLQKAYHVFAHNWIKI